MRSGLEDLERGGGGITFVGDNNHFTMSKAFYAGVNAFKALI